MTKTPSIIDLLEINVDWLLEIRSSTTFANVPASNLEKILYTLPIKQIGLYSWSPFGLEFLDINVRKEDEKAFEI